MKKEVKVLFIVSLSIFIIMFVLGLVFLFNAYSYGFDWAYREVSVYNQDLMFKTGIALYMIIGTIFTLISCVGFLIDYTIYLRYRMKAK